VCGDATSQLATRISAVSTSSATNLAAAGEAIAAFAADVKTLSDDIQSTC